MTVGRGVVAMLREAGADFSAPAVEIGCGTGLVSLGLIAEAAYPLTLITDPSPAFLRITRKKVRKHGLDESRARYAVLMGEEIDRLPPEAFSLVVLRSTLHHVLDVDRFIRDSARSLRPGGVLTFQEPCMEGYVLMGAMAQFMPHAVERSGKKLTEPQASQVQQFVNTMKFYARRDLDKSKAEDKHLFRVDELMTVGAACGLAVEFRPNTTFDAYASPAGQRPGPDAFTPFFRGYLKYCMSWDEGLVKLFDEHFAPYCRFIEDMKGRGGTPYLHGVFVCRKN